MIGMNSADAFCLTEQVASATGIGIEAFTFVFVENTNDNRPVIEVGFDNRILVQVEILYNFGVKSQIELEHFLPPYSQI